MRPRKIAAMASNCQWQPKIKINRKRKLTSGSINLAFAVLIFTVIAGLFYLYSTNSNAVQGYQIKKVEKELFDLKKENEQLRIQEAEIKSLNRIEESSKNLNMEETKAVSYVEEQGPVAMK